jgi:uncharacterized protein
MSETSQEPTMEEILASIRRIISEDDTPAAEAGAEAAAPAAEPEPQAPAAAAPEPEPEPVKAEAPPPLPEPEPAPPPPEAVAELADEEPEDEPLELTQKVESLGDLDVVEPPAAEPPAPPPAAVPAPEPALVSQAAAVAAASAFGQLSAAIAMPREGRTLEDVVRELLQPLLKGWLDENLPKIVQQAVEAEVERISRGRVH